MKPRYNRRLSKKDVVRMQQLLRQGWRVVSVAKEFNVAPPTVYYHCPGGTRFYQK